MTKELDCQNPPGSRVIISRRKNLLRDGKGLLPPTPPRFRKLLLGVGPTLILRHSSRGCFTNPETSCLNRADLPAHSTQALSIARCCGG